MTSTTPLPNPVKLFWLRGDITEFALFLAGFVSLIGLVARMAGVWQ